MSEQTQALILTRVKLSSGDGYVFLAKDSRNGDEVWMHKTPDECYHPYPRRFFNTITDFHDFVAYRRRNPFR